jgi:hypothetical protein
MRLPLAIGAVVEGLPETFQMPLSGQVLPVPTRVPRGVFALVAIATLLAASHCLGAIGGVSRGRQGTETYLVPNRRGSGLRASPLPIRRAGGSLARSFPALRDSGTTLPLASGQSESGDLISDF